MPSLKTQRVQTSGVPQLLPVQDLTGGLDLRRAPTLLAPNRARRNQNVSLEEPGAWTVMPGYRQASTASMGSNPTGGQRVYLDGYTFTLLAMDGSVYKPDAAWVRGSAVHSTISTANQTFFPYDRDLVGVFDGANRPRCSTDGSTWILMGVDAPSTGPVLSSIAGSLSSGKFAVAYTYKHRGTAAESSVSAESTKTLTASTGGGLRFTPVASTDPKVDAVVAYARHVLPDAESILRKVSSGAVGAALDITSSNWTSADAAPTQNGVPPTGLKFGTPWKNRWWAPDGTVSNRLWFTEVFQPQSWPATYYIDIPFDRGDAITAIQALGDVLMVFGQSGIYAIIGQTSLDFEVRPMQGADVGAYGPRAVSRIEQSVVHVAADDIASNDGASDRSLAFDIQVALRDLAGNSAGTDLAKVASVYDGLRKELHVSAPRVYPTGARGELVLNLDRTRENDGAPAWTTSDRNIAFYIHYNGNEPTAGNRGKLFTIPSSGGPIFEQNSSNSAANSSAITATYEGPALSLGVHHARAVGTHLEFEPHAGAFSIELVADGVSQGTLPVDISGGAVTWGSTGMVWGSFTWGGETRAKAYVLHPLGAEGQAFVLKGTYTGREQFKWFSYAHLIVPEPSPRTL